jgi:hypothetical protein
VRYQNPLQRENMKELARVNSFTYSIGDPEESRKNKGVRVTAEEKMAKSIPQLKRDESSYFKRYTGLGPWLK